MKVGKFTNIEANTTATVVSPVSCVLMKVIINTIGATGNILTIYDNASAASGTVVATIDTTIAGAPVREFNCILQNGCTVSLTPGTAAKITIVTD